MVSGTLEELAEVASWAQLGLHAKPIGLLGRAGYWDPLLAWLDHAVDGGLRRARQPRARQRATPISPRSSTASVARRARSDRPLEQLTRRRYDPALGFAFGALVGFGVGHGSRVRARVAERPAATARIAARSGACESP